MNSTPGPSSRRLPRAGVVLALALALLTGGVIAPPAALAVDGTETTAPSSERGLWFLGGSQWQGDFADPSVTRVGDTYYAYATMTAGRYVPTLVSTDLVTWRARPGWSTAGPAGKRGYSVATDPAIPAEIRALSQNEFERYNLNDSLVKPASWALKTQQEGDWVRRTYWAPSALQIGSTWYLYSTVQVAAGRWCLTVATGPSPLGPFRDDTTGPIQCQAEADDPAGSIDPFAYHDAASGKDYLLWRAMGKGGSHPASLRAVELGADGLPVPGRAPVQLLQTAEDGWEGFSIENPSMVTYGGTTYLFYSGNSWDTSDDIGTSSYGTGYAVCPRGPLAACERIDTDPLLSSSGTAQGPGGSSVFLDAQGGLRLATATYFRGENRVGEPLTNPRRMSIVSLTQGAGGRLSVVPGTGPVGTPYRALGGRTALPDQVVTDVAHLTGQAVNRVAGGDRYSTSVDASRAAFASAGRVYLALGSDFPDALGAAAAAGVQGAPVLLVTRDSIPAPVRAELTRLGPSRITVVGGASVITDAVLEQARAATGVRADRISGGDRYETAARVATDAGSASGTVYLASGEGFPDALSATSAAAMSSSPVLLTQRSSLPPAARAALGALAPDRVVVVGGSAVVQDQVLDQVRAAVPGAAVERVAGGDRYETALAVLEQGERPGSLWLASGTGFPDALSGASAAAAAGAALLIVAPGGPTADQGRRLQALL